MYFCYRINKSFLIHLRQLLSLLLLLRVNRWETMMVILAYYILNLGYCARLKQYAVLDVCIIAFGFVLRLLAGGLATEVALSKWIVLMTFLITLFMSFAKRRDDVLRMNETGEAPRANTIRYNLTFINQAITINRLCDISMLHHVYSVARGDRACQFRLSVSYIGVCSAWYVAIYTDCCCG